MGQKMLEEVRRKIDNEIKEAKNDFTAERLDMSIGEMLNLYKNKELFIAPEFQRLFRWNNYQRTRLIESLLLGIPIPPIFVVQNDTGEWELVDGLQRLSTLFSFMGELSDSDKNNWKLDEGDILKTIKDLSFDELSMRAKLDIKRYVCRVEIISSYSDYNVRFELFNRLNTGGTKLSQQEIRNVLYRDVSTHFNRFLRDRGTDNEEFLALINISETKKESLFADELVLRFCSIYGTKKITKVLSQHMDNFMKRTVNETTEDMSKINEYGYIFNQVVSLLYELDDIEIFVPISKRGGFSTSIYDGIMQGLANNLHLYVNNKEVLSEKIEELKKEFANKGVLGSQAHNPKKVMERVKLANSIFGTDD